MADLMATKSSNVVSSNTTKKTSDVCSVKSNNGLIELDNITTSNNELIKMCDDIDDDDDLITTKNTKNELTTDDKSLQEMIESELALRICSANEEKELDQLDDDNDDNDEDSTSTKPSVTIKKIILEPRQDPPLDINAEFIGAEMEHYSIVQDPYTYRNGHTSPGSGESRSPERPNSEFNPAEKCELKQNDESTASLVVEDVNRQHSADLRPDDEEVIEDEILVQSESEPGSWSTTEAFKFIKTTEKVNPKVDEELHTDQLKSYTKEPIDETTTWIGSKDHKNVTDDQLTAEMKNLNYTDVWLDPTSVSSVVAGQFSDDFGGMANREDDRVEAEEPEDDQHQNFHQTQIPKLEDSVDHENHPKGYDNIDADEDSKAEADIPQTSDNNHHERVIQETPVLEESVKSFQSLPNTDSSKVQSSQDILPDNIENSVEAINADIERTKIFIGEECNALIKEYQDDGNSETDAAATNEYLGENLVHVDVPTLAEGVQKFSSNELLGNDDERKESETSWITVEEATNELADTIKSAEIINGIHEVNVNEVNIDFLEDGLQTGHTDETTTTLTTMTINGLEDTTAEETKKIIAANHNEQSHNTTKIDTSFVQQTKDTVRLSNNDIDTSLATSDDESTEFSNSCDNEKREEVITSSTLVTSSSTTSTKTSTKTKKKKIEGVAGNDASPTLTPRTKKTKKSKKNDLEKENISVNINTEEPISMHTTSRQVSQEVDEFSDEDDLSNVNVKSLTQSYVSETSRGEQEKANKEIIETGVSIKQLCRSFGDISNMTDIEQSTYGITEQTTETHEKAKSMDDLRLCQRDFKKLARDATVFVGVSVKALRASYCSLANLTGDLDEDIQQQTPNDRLNFERSSFNKFDALSKKTVLHVRSVDAGKVQQQLNSVGQNGDANPNCRSCGKVVFQMEQTKAEGLVWHKNCFRCVQCSKQLNVDNYQSHESTLYCKAHFKELFQPKPVEESDQPVRPRKPEMIIRENQPKELPPDVVRASDKPDLGLEELSSLNVKSRFQVFEKSNNDVTNEIERSPSQVVKRSPSILSKLAKFQAKGMDIGVADDSLNGIPYEESSESEEEEEIEESEELENEIIKSKRTTRERPISFTKMDDIKNRWESTSQQGRRESQREARKEEIAGIRSRLFMGKQGKMKEMYQQAVAESERVTKTNATEEIQHSTHARSIKERFERGEPIATSDGEDDSKPKQEKPDEEVIAAGISRKSRSLFLELDASAAKTGRPVTPVNPKTPTDVSRRARDAFMGRQVSDDVVRSTDTTAEVQVETSDISNKFKFFETYKEPAKERKQFRITPPRDGQVKQMGSPEREIYRDPDVIRAEDRVDEVVHTDTARKMLSIFRQMEEKATKEDIPDGPKPLKRFTPPPEDKFAKATASDSEEEEEEEGEESEDEESGEDRDPNYVRASDKVEDEFLKQAQNAARAKTLRAKFEHWETTDGKVTNHHVAEMDMAQGNGDQASIESASSLRARFESLGSTTTDSPRATKVKVNRFVEIQTICMDVCESCQKKVYPLEKVETNNKIFHKQCFRCLQCNCVLRMDTFTLNNGKLYCIPHFKQLFIARGNYDEGFGADPHKNKWSTTNNTNSTNASTPATIAVSNGLSTPVANRV